MSGHRAELVSIVAFSVLIVSVGRPSLFQVATCASSVNIDNGSKSSVVSILGYKRKYEILTSLQTIQLYIIL